MSGILFVDTRELRKLSSDLKALKDKAYPIAVKEGLNRTAVAARNVWEGEIKEAFILRNHWTVGSLRVARVNQGMDPRRMMAVTGSISRYMGTQEEGGTKRKHGKHGVAIPTRVASGEGRGAGVRRRLVRGPYKLGALQVQKRMGASRKQRNAVAIRRALAGGKKFVFLETQRTKGIFRLSGSRKRPTVDLLWGISRPSVRIPASHTLERSLSKLKPHQPAIMLGALREQAARHRILGY